ncbi:hypothetical protein GQ472_04965 [archaeon]|nr:hypothetical protein [archaeon]
MDMTSLFFYLISLTLVLISFAILKKKAGYQVNLILDGKCTKYSLNEIKNLKNDLKSLGIYKSVIHEAKDCSISPLKTITYSSKSGKLIVEEKNGMLNSKYDYQREEAISKIKDGLGISLKGKLTPTVPSINLSFGEPLKGQNKYNKQTKSLLKKDTFTKSDYENLSKLIDDQAKLTDSNKEALEERIKEEAESINFDNIKEKDAKYDFLEKYAKSLGFQDEYDKAKMKISKDEIEHEGLSSKDIIPSEDPVDIVGSADKREKLSALEKVADESGLLDKLVEKYVSALEDELKTQNRFYDKKELLESIFNYSPEDKLKQKIADEVREQVIGSELKYIKTKLKDIDKTDENIFKLGNHPNKIHNINDLIKEAHFFAEKGNISNKKNTTGIYSSFEKLDGKIITDFMNEFLTKSLSLGIVSDNKKQKNKKTKYSPTMTIISDMRTSDINFFNDSTTAAFIEFFTNMPSVDKFSEIVDTDALKDNYALGKAISDVIMQRSIEKKNELNVKNNIPTQDNMDLKGLAKDIKDITSWTIEVPSGYLSDDSGKNVLDQMDNFLLEKTINVVGNKDELNDDIAFIENLLRAPYIHSDSADKSALLALEERKSILNDLKALYDQDDKKREKAEKDMTKLIKEVKERLEKRQNNSKHILPSMPQGAQASEIIMSEYQNAFKKQSQN